MVQRKVEEAGEGVRCLVKCDVIVKNIAETPNLSLKKLDLTLIFKRRPPSFSILASMLSGVLPTGKFEGRQQLRSDRAHVAVFADHPPPPKLEGIVEEVDVDEYTDSE